MRHLADGELLEMVSGRLTGPERAAADAHADQCPECRARLAELSSGWELLGRWELPDDTSDLRERVLEAAGRDRRETGGRWWTWLWARPLARAAAAVVLAGAGGFGLGWSTSPKAPSAGADVAGQMARSVVVREMRLDVLGSSPVGLEQTILGVESKNGEVLP